MQAQSLSPIILRLAAQKTTLSIAFALAGVLLAVWRVIAAGLPAALTDPAAPLAILVAAGSLAGLVYLGLGLAQAQAAQAELARANAMLNETIEAQRAVRQETARQKLLAENLLVVARATGQRPVLDATIENTAGICLALTGATHSSLFLLDTDGRVTRQLLVRQNLPPQEAHHVVGQVMSDGLAGWVLRNRKAARVGDVSTDPRWITLPHEPYHTRSALVAPFVSREVIVGLITLMHPQPNHFTEEHEQLLLDAAEQIGVALDNARMFHTMTSLADRLSMLYGISQAAKDLDLDSALVEATRGVRAATGWPSITVYLSEGGQLAARASAGEAELRVEPGTSAPEGSLVHRAIAQLAEQKTPDGTEIAVPIQAGQEALGALYAQSPTGRRFDAQDLDLLSAVADTLALAVAYTQLAAQTHTQSG